MYPKLGMAKNFSTDFTVITTLLPFESSDHLKHPDIRVVKCDVTSEEQTLDLKAQVEGISGGRLDVLINNAGICKITRCILEIHVDICLNDGGF